MKKDDQNFSKTTLALAILVALNFVSCHKRPFDARNKYVGKWTVNYIRDDWRLGRTPMHVFDSGEFESYIHYHTNGASKGTLEIEFYPGMTRPFKVKDDGTLSVEGKVGTISKTKLDMILTNSNTGMYGLGSGQDYTVTAVKL